MGPQRAVERQGSCMGPYTNRTPIQGNPATSCEPSGPVVSKQDSDGNLSEPDTTMARRVLTDRLTDLYWCTTGIGTLTCPDGTIRDPDVP